jgi:hypothetical protein
MTGEVVPIGIPKLRYAKPKPCAMCGVAVAAKRSTRRFCGVNCRMRAYRRRRDGPLRRRPRPALTAHQARFAQIADGIDIGTATVREISYAEARDLIERVEWLGTMPALVTHCFGLLFGERLGGVVVFGPEPGGNLGIWKRYGFDGRIVSLLRGCSEPWAHPHSASKLIRGAMRLLPARFQVITATLDSLAGEIGTVYAASGFSHVGTMCDGGRALIHYEGRVVSERQARRRFGTAGRRELARLGIRSVAVPRRARVFAFRGSRREQAALRASIEHLERPYPKRSEARP